MTPRPRPRERRLRRLALVPVVAGAVLLSACNSDDSGPVLDSAALKGKQVAQDKGCLACHSLQSSERKEGPTWQGLYGKQVKLDDGTTVTADDAYLTRAIKDPKAEKVEGYANFQMPQANISDAEIKSVIDLIKALK